MELDKIFKAYDVRGIYPNQIDEDVAAKIGEAYAATRRPRKVAVGQDVRSSGKKLKKRLIEALLDAGVDVVDIGVITTDQLYFAVGNYGFDGGISVTASHNPGEYNGFKFIDEGGKPFSGSSLEAIKEWVLADKKTEKTKPGNLTSQVIIDAYVEKVLSFVNTNHIKPLHIVANANFGAVGRTIDKLSERLNLKLDRLNWQENGDFPKGPPNPLLPGSRQETSDLIKKNQPDLGVAWDADADRCFFFTGDGEFIPSCFIIALLSAKFLEEYPHSHIVHDITLNWVIDDAVKAHGGIPVDNRVGHTFIKAKMREVDAPFGAESSGHYYFRDSYYADNGIVPLLMILEMISESGRSLDELIAPMRSAYFVADETNFEATDPADAIRRIEERLGPEGNVDKTDGVTIESKNWRINLRPSNTEPLIRLNAEGRSQEQLAEITKRVLELINS